MIKHRKVCILAAGPNGRDHYTRIPDDAFIIAVNKAVLLEKPRPADRWMAVDSPIVDQEWFEEAWTTFKGQKLFGPTAGSLAVSRFGGTYDMLVCVLRFAIPFRKKDDVVVWRNEQLTNITAYALQVALSADDANEILLCGADFKGHQYWDGSPVSRSEGQPPPQPGEEWSDAEYVSWFLEGITRGSHVKILSLSDTALQVPPYLSP